jgi:Carboxypeptidase regulatory-like domain
MPREDSAARSPSPSVWLRVAVLAAATSLVGVNVVHSQSQATGGELTGEARDELRGVLTGVALKLTHQATGFTRTLTTDPAGEFAFRALPVGDYTLEAYLAGFEPYKVTDVSISLGTSARLNLTLKLAGRQYDVNVVASRNLSDPQQAGLGSVVDRPSLDRLPVNARNFLSFSLLTNGSSPDRTPQQGASRTSGVVLAGQRARSNNVTVDGLDNNDETVGSVRAMFSQDAVQEFQVLTNGFSAEFGKAAGGVINVVTRSGTNRTSGTGYAFFRDDALNARNYFERYSLLGEPISVERAPYGQQQFGATLGGPLRRDRAFYFASIERQQVDANNFVTIDDETNITHPFQPAVSLGTPADILRAAGFRLETGHVPYQVRSTQWFGKYDQFIGERQRLSVRLNGASELNENIEPFGGLVARSRAAVLDNTDVMGAGSHNFVATSRLVNEARFLVAWREQLVSALDPACEGACDREDEGGPTIEVSGVASLGRQRFTPTPRNNIRYQFVDTLSYSRGRHLFKAGADVSIVQGLDQALPLHFGGRYIFTGFAATPGAFPAPVSSIQSVALGLPLAYVQGYGHSGSAYDYRDLALFAEDVWQVHPRFGVRAGLRYERQMFPSETFQVAGMRESYEWPSDGNNVAPRVGVTWDASGSARTVVRAAYGLYYDPIITATAGITRYISGRPDTVRTFVLTAPGAFAAWAAPGRRLPESTALLLAGGSYPSVAITIDPGLQNPYAHHAFVGADHLLGPRVRASAGFVYARGFKQLGTIDYNPVLLDLGPGRRPADVNGQAGTSASVLQYTSFGETWFRGLTLSLDGRVENRWFYRVGYTLSKAEDTSTDFQSAFLPQNNGRGRDQGRPFGLPIAFEPHAERGPALHDERHRLVATASYNGPKGFVISGLVSAASGWPYNILAGTDLNGDRDGGSFPSDRARRVPAEASSSVARNAGRLPSQFGVDMRLSKSMRLSDRVQVEGLLELFNLFNRTNFTDVQNVFGVGAYPDNPSPTFGKFTQAGNSRQIQLAARVRF